ncbi:hypothetical protein PG991_014000 [Apiospora marii]|uniref:Uncharacterized protein n=1 Tax=Apiospora marii TaxID=335849 RepID=A0ABR1R7R4_9PEZI
MAPIELAYFCYKKDEELVRVADTKLMPIGIKTFRDGGAKRGLAGQITSEDGRDVTADSRRLFVLGETGAALWSLEIIEVKPKDADMSEEAAQDIFQKVAEWSRSGSGSGGDAAACGTSLDPKTKEIVVIRTISSQEPAEVDDSSRYPALAEIAEVALMKRMVAQVGLM